MAGGDRSGPATCLQDGSELHGQWRDVHGGDIPQDVVVHVVVAWTGPEDSCEWRLLVSQPGRYRVLVSYAAPPESSRRPFSVQVGQQALNARVISTGEGYRYREVELGILDLKKAGPMTVLVRPRESGGNLMYLQRVVLRQVGGVAIE